MRFNMLFLIHISLLVFAFSLCLGRDSKQSTVETWETKKGIEYGRLMGIASCIKNSDSEKEARRCTNIDLSGPCDSRFWFRCKKRKVEFYEELARCILNTSSEQEAYTKCYSKVFR